MKIGAKILKWRRGQKRGAIMQPSTFKKIEQSAEASGKDSERAKKIAGAIYWSAVRKKFAASKGKK